MRPQLSLRMLIVYVVVILTIAFACSKQEPVKQDIEQYGPVRKTDTTLKA